MSESRAIEATGRVAAIILAAGRGERAGGRDGPKQYRMIGGRAVIARAIEGFAECRSVDAIVVAIHPDDRDLFARAAGAFAGRVSLVEGGPTRQASTLNALRALSERAPEKVLIHDAARPFANHSLIDRVLAAVTSSGGALPVLPVADTIKKSDDSGLVAATVPRSGLFAAQTPQGFPYAAILEAHERAATSKALDFTDDSSIAEWAGMPMRMVEGSPDNVKLTLTREIEMADARLSATGGLPDVRTGNGYDVHAFEAGRAVMLCGIEIPHDRKLSGHSDADVGLHALTDALLATCGAGDIGTHFPPSEPEWRGARSRIFVEYAARLVAERGGRIANADVTLVCEAPRIGPHRPAMVAAMAEMLGIEPGRISVKATTNEGMGFIGRGEGIAAFATVSVVFPGGLS